MTAHWAVPDPAAVIGLEERIDRAFRDAFNVLDRRISLLLCLPFASLGKLAIEKQIDRIGKELPEVKGERLSDSVAAARKPVLSCLSRSHSEDLGKSCNSSLGEN